MALLIAELWNLNLELLVQVLGLEILNTTKQVIQYLESLWHNTTTNTWVTIIWANWCGQIKVKTTSKAVSYGDSVLGVGTGIKANDQIRLSKELFVVLYVMDQIFDFTFFTALNCNCASWMSKTKFLAGFDS